MHIGFARKLQILYFLLLSVKLIYHIDYILTNDL